MADPLEVRYRARIGPRDFDTRTRRVIRHLKEGHKVRVAVRFTGREVLHPEVGQQLLRQIAWLADDSGQVEWLGDLKRRRIEMLLIPRRSPPWPPDAGDRGPRLPVGDGPETGTAVEAET